MNKTRVLCVLEAAVVAAALLAIVYVFWQARAQPARISQTYYSQVNVFWSSACDCWKDANGHTWRRVPVIVNGNVHGAGTAPAGGRATALAAAATGAVPRTWYDVDRAPFISNGDVWFDVPGGTAVSCHREPQARGCPVTGSTAVTPPTAEVPEPNGVVMFGLGALGILGLRRVRK